MHPEEIATRIVWTDLEGGKTGEEVQFSIPSSTLTAVRGRIGTNIDQIQFLFTDIQTGELRSSPAWGGPGGQEFLCRALPGQYIDRILLKVWDSGILAAIQTETNQGVRSGKRGQGDNAKVVELEAKGKRICGVRCRVEKYINALGVQVVEPEEEED